MILKGFLTDFPRIIKGFPKDSWNIIEHYW